MTRIDDKALRPLRKRSLVALLLAMFAIAVGYGFLLPILPSTIARMVGTSDPAILARHTGALTGTYTLALLLFAPLWGRLSDRYGRWVAIVAGLVGFARPWRYSPWPAASPPSISAVPEHRRPTWR